MASQLHLSANAAAAKATPGKPAVPPRTGYSPSVLQIAAFGARYRSSSSSRNFAIRSSTDGSGGGGGGDSYLDMWKRSVERKKEEENFQRIVENSSQNVYGDDGRGSEAADEAEGGVNAEELERRSTEFQRILEVPREERDRVQRMQVIDRAAAALAAARTVLKEVRSVPPVNEKADSDAYGKDNGAGYSGAESGGSFAQDKERAESLYNRQSRSSKIGTPGPDFWSWIPPPDDDATSGGASYLQGSQKQSFDANKTMPVLEKDLSPDTLSLPFESKLYEKTALSPIPPSQSLFEAEKVEVPGSNLENMTSMQNIEVDFASHAAEAAQALEKGDENLSNVRNPDGSRSWRETGVETRPDGVVCKWTMLRGVTADEAVEWEVKYWEAANDFGHKELGSEKSGRDAEGNVWHEYWTESMWQEGGLLHMQKTADKWGKKGDDSEWHEKWNEHYDASGRADKWAHKWCSIDPTTVLDPGHAHVWHERWGETYDGMGGSIKYTDKWAERCEGDGWSKWGDKWDENFNLHGHGVKQGETWWQGKCGDQWNRTWGERHNGSGWLHKYGKSSSGEHWDTYAQEDTWYERFPHYGFMHCFENSVQLKEVKKPSESNPENETQ